MGAVRQGRGKRAAHEQQSGKRGPAGLKRLRERREMAGRRQRLANAREVLPASMRAGGVPRRFAESDRQSARHTRKPAPAATGAALRYAGRRELSEGSLRFTKVRRAQVPIAPCDTRAESARYFAEDSPIPRQHNSPLCTAKSRPTVRGVARLYLHPPRLGVASLLRMLLPCLTITHLQRQAPPHGA